MSAVAVGAAALFQAPVPEVRSAPARRLRAAPAAGHPLAVASAAIPSSARVRAINAEDIERALSSASTGQRDLVLERMLATWVGAEPAAAVRCAELQTEPFLREVALRAVAQGWARIDPDAAARWAAALAEPGERDQALGHVALILGDSDARRALDVLAQRGGEPRADAARAGVITSWASRDFAAAQSWLEAQPPDAARDDIALRLTFLRAQTDAPAALRFADRMLDDAARRDAFASVMRTWVARDPEAARASLSFEDAELVIDGPPSSSDP